MSNVNIFEQASRAKLRWETSVGVLSVEDLWNLPLDHPSKANLNGLAIDLDKRVKAAGTVSFVKKEAMVDPKLQLSFDVVKYVIDTRLVEEEGREKAAARAAEKAKLLELLADKEDAALSKLSVAELRRRITALS